MGKKGIIISVCFCSMKRVGKDIPQGITSHIPEKSVGLKARNPGGTIGVKTSTWRNTPAK